MKPFAYAAPKSIKEATELLGDRWGETEILACGTDLVTSLKQGLTTPTRVVSLRHVKDIKGVDASRSQVRIGAMTTLRQLAEDRSIRQHFPSLATAVDAIGSPQILSSGTVGGDLCQRPRCWYYRNGFGLFGRQEDTSLVKEGDNRYHAIFGNEGSALFVSPSSLGPALIALGGTVSLAGPQGKTRTISVAAFFQIPKTDSDRETVLRPNEVLTEIIVPIKGLRNATYEIRHRQGFDWPYVTASVAFELKSGTVSKSSVVLGHVAPTPWASAAAARAIDGSSLNDGSAARSGQAASEGANPLSGNAYKVQMVKTAVKRALLAAAA